jgi:hypothetical protein
VAVLPLEVGDERVTLGLGERIGIGVDLRRPTERLERVVGHETVDGAGVPIERPEGAVDHVPGGLHFEALATLRLGTRQLRPEVLECGGRHVGERDVSEDREDVPGEV